MTDDIVTALRHSYHLADVQPDHILRRACEEIERLRAELAQQQCPYIRSGSEGTHWCALAAQPAPSAEDRYCDTHCTWRDHAAGCVRAPSAEPVAWRFQSAVGGWAYGPQPPLGSKYPAYPLYAAPPDQREAMRQALEVLEQLSGGCTDSNDGTVEAITVWCPEVIDALRAALGDDK